MTSVIVCYFEEYGWLSFVALRNEASLLPSILLAPRKTMRDVAIHLNRNRRNHKSHQSSNWHELWQLRRRDLYSGSLFRFATKNRRVRNPQNNNACIYIEIYMIYAMKLRIDTKVAWAITEMRQLIRCYQRKCQWYPILHEHCDLQRIHNHSLGTITLRSRLHKIRM